MLAEYGLSQSTMLLYCENLSAINILKNLVKHGRAKHIGIHHHFIYELVED